MYFQYMSEILVLDLNKVVKFQKLKSYNTIRLQNNNAERIVMV